jgi:hypothetical protein
MLFTLEIKFIHWLAGLMGQWMSKDFSDAIENNMTIF